MITPLKLQVRFADIDLMGHVNNAVYLNYFEQARLYYFEQLLGGLWNWKAFGIILKVNQVEYHHPIFLQDHPGIRVKLKHLGTKSFTLAYELYVGQELRTTGHSVIVCYDFTRNETREVYPELREALMKLEKTEA